MICGSSTKEAVLRGVGQLVQEIEANEDALARASSHTKEVIQKGSMELTRQRGLFSIVWKGLKKKNKSWQVEVESRERDVAQREQQLAVREAELAGEAKALDIRKKELENEAERRLAEAEKKHQEALTEKARDIRDLQLKETEAWKAIEDAEKRLLRRRKMPAPCGSMPS